MIRQMRGGLHIRKIDIMRLLLAVFLLFVAFCFSSVPVEAETNIENASLTLEKVLYIEEDAAIPNVEFFYTIEPTYGGKGSVIYNIRDGVEGAAITSANFFGGGRP